MGILTRDAILARIDDGSLRIDPFDPAAVGPASVDLHLDRQFRVFKKVHAVYHVTEDLERADVTDLLEVDDYFVLMPGEAALGITRERLTLPDDLCGWLEGRSRFARGGVNDSHYRQLHASGHRQPAGAGDVQRWPYSPSHPSPVSRSASSSSRSASGAPTMRAASIISCPSNPRARPPPPAPTPTAGTTPACRCRPGCPAPVQALPAPLSACARTTARASSSNGAASNSGMRRAANGPGWPRRPSWTGTTIGRLVASNAAITASTTGRLDQRMIHQRHHHGVTHVWRERPQPRLQRGQLP